jgi:acyl-CoA thioester hydrolase
MAPSLPHVKETEIRVRFAETDMMGIVHHSNYLIYLEAARIDFTHQINAPYADLEAGGHSLAVTDIEIRYHAPARFDELITVYTWIADMRSRLITFAYEIVNDHKSRQLLVSAKTKLICVDHQNQVRRIPDSWYTLMRSMVVSS